MTEVGVRLVNNLCLRKGDSATVTDNEYEIRLCPAAAEGPERWETPLRIDAFRQIRPENYSRNPVEIRLHIVPNWPAASCSIDHIASEGAVLRAKGMCRRQAPKVCIFLAIKDLSLSGQADLPKFPPSMTIFRRLSGGTLLSG